MKLGRSLVRGLGVAATVFLLGVAAPAPAQQAEGQQFSQGDIQSFAVAAIKVNGVRQKWLPRLEAAASPEEAGTLHKEGLKEIVAVIEAQGLTVETYNAIADAGNGDPALRQQIIELMGKAHATGSQ